MSTVLCFTYSLPSALKLPGVVPLIKHGPPPRHHLHRSLLWGTCVAEVRSNSSVVVNLSLVVELQGVCLWGLSLARACRGYTPDGLTKGEIGDRSPALAPPKRPMNLGRAITLQPGQAVHSPCTVQEPLIFFTRISSPFCFFAFLGCLCFSQSR